ncbi:hypothetical protein [Deinococcus sp.]
MTDRSEIEDRTDSAAEHLQCGAPDMGAARTYDRGSAVGQSLDGA